MSKEMSIESLYANGMGIIYEDKPINNIKQESYPCSSIIDNSYISNSLEYLEYHSIIEKNNTKDMIKLNNRLYNTYGKYNDKLGNYLINNANTSKENYNNYINNNKELYNELCMSREGLFGDKKVKEILKDSVKLKPVYETVKKIRDTILYIESDEFKNNIKKHVSEMIKSDNFQVWSDASSSSELIQSKNENKDIMSFIKRILTDMSKKGDKMENIILLSHATIQCNSKDEKIMDKLDNKCGSISKYISTEINKVNNTINVYPDGRNDWYFKILFDLKKLNLSSFL